MQYEETEHFSVMAYKQVVITSYLKPSEEVGLRRGGRAESVPVLLSPTRQLTARLAAVREGERVPKELPRGLGCSGSWRWGRGTHGAGGGAAAPAAACGLCWLSHLRPAARFPALCRAGASCCVPEAGVKRGQRAVPVEWKGWQRRGCERGWSLESHGGSLVNSAPILFNFSYSKIECSAPNAS